MGSPLLLGDDLDVEPLVDEAAGGHVHLGVLAGPAGAAGGGAATKYG